MSFVWSGGGHTGRGERLPQGEQPFEAASRWAISSRRPETSGGDGREMDSAGWWRFGEPAQPACSYELLLSSVRERWTRLGRSRRGSLWRRVVEGPASHCAVCGEDWRSFLVGRLQRRIGCFNAAGQAAALVAAEHVKRRLRCVGRRTQERSRGHNGSQSVGTTTFGMCCAWRAGEGVRAGWALLRQSRFRWCCGVSLKG